MQKKKVEVKPKNENLDISNLTNPKKQVKKKEKTAPSWNQLADAETLAKEDRDK